jgi:putative CocE/NonD family hydrolase
MQLHFGRRERIPQVPPSLTQFLIATKIAFPVSHSSPRLGSPLPLWPIFRALIFLLALPLLGPQASAQAHPQTQSSPPIYPSMVKIQSSIPMKDGIRLAVNLYMPEGAKPDDKFPAILEYLPYRKDDWTLERDWNLHSYFVRRGYVTARVDIRGTGASEGAPPDREYSDQEQQDGLEIIAWLARQPWSNGNVGMMGISWGGFNAIQIARLHPPALKAIIAVCATEELFHDDIHYIDGMMHVDEFESAMDLELGVTRAPDFPTDEKSLAPRFDSSPWFLLYLRQQRDGPFWRRASVAPDHYADYTVPSFMVGGFLDGYRDSLARFFEKSRAPIKALLGPWNHSFPHNAEPGPAIEWRDEATRWWDYWLKGKQNGIMDEPRFEVYMRRPYPPDPNIKEIPGEWRAEKSWPPTGQRAETYHLHMDHKLDPSGPATSPLSSYIPSEQLKYLPSIGIEAGFWWGDFTTDQRPLDAFSLVYDSEPLKEAKAILGRPKSILFASAGVPLADWFVRLSDVAPDGTITMITGAGQQGAECGSTPDSITLSEVDKEGETLKEICPISIEMHLTSWIFQPGHRIRLAISNALWPMIWPTPYPMTTSLFLGAAAPSRLELPLIPLEPPARPHFPAIEESPALEGVSSTGDIWPPKEWTVTRDLMTGATRVAWSGEDAGHYPWGNTEDFEQMSYVVQDSNPAASTVHADASTTVMLPGRTLVWSVVLDLRSDAKNFYYRFERRLTENGALIRKKSWDETIPRDHQ